jgi:putative transposase
MAYLRVWVHMVWSTKNREALLVDKGVRGGVFDHIATNASHKGIFLDCINGSFDHVHALISLGPDQTLAKVAQLIKGESSHWINQERLISRKFEWQDDYFAASVSDSAVDIVRRYISNQEEHHRKKLFSEEYAEFLRLHRFSEIPQE